MPIHFLGGFWVGITLAWGFQIKNLSWAALLKVLLGFFVVGIGWEVFEILVDKSITDNLFNLTDTVSDLFNGAAGTLLALFYFFKKIMREEAIKV